MKKLVMLTVVALTLAVMTPAGWAQAKPQDQDEKKEHGNLGAYFDFTRLQSASVNLLGVGGRMGFAIPKIGVLEAELAYDFQRTQSVTVTAGGVSSTVRSNVSMLHALFGPKIRMPHTKNFFFVAKAGIVNFGVSGPAIAGTINNQIGTIINGDVNTAFFPGAGVDFKIRKISFRAEAGDEIIWLRDGAHNNFRATFGPQLRF
jgi:hypothetical protein